VLQKDLMVSCSDFCANFRRVAKTVLAIKSARHRAERNTTAKISFFSLEESFELFKVTLTGLGSLATLSALAVRSLK